MRSGGAIDPSSGFCYSTATFCSKRPPVALPSDPFLTVPDFVFQRPDFDPSHPAYIDADSGLSISYGLLRSRVSAVASGLAHFGLRPGDVILLLSPNSVSFAILLLASMSLGAVVTTTNPLNRPHEIAKQMSDSCSGFVATTPSLLSSVLQEVTRRKLPVILIDDDEKAGDDFHAAGLSRWVLLTELQRADPARRSTVVLHRTRQEDTAALLFSSGTTGMSKGVIITHRNLIAQVSLLFAEDGGTPWPSHIYLCLLPMFHVYGLAFFACGCLARGSTIVLLRKFELVQVLAAIQKYRVTTFPTVPPIFIALAKSPVVENYDLSSLTTVGSGAAPLSKEVIEAFQARFPNALIAQGYGLTESTAVGASTGVEDGSGHHGSAGLVAPNTELRIICQNSGKPLGPNEKGEIWLRGPTIMKGYFGKPGETAATIDKEEWLHTGDLGYVDAEGYLYVVDRLKELIKYKGFQVAPAELEAVLLSHSEIADAAVIPYPDHEAGQIPMAYVVKRTGSTLTEIDVMNFVSEQVAPYKKIRRVAIVKSIPKSSSGKILRQQLISKAISKL